jgi:NAD+ synthase (glutamine-hydrolysing)
MPAEASSEHTQNNAVRLARALGLQNEIIPISTLVGEQLRALGHNETTQDITYENVQARLRTSLLFNRANQLHAIVLGTGDLSEIALGWCTYNGDHISHYNVNASIPKTLVKHLVAHLAAQPEFKRARPMLLSILETPISPELTKHDGGVISQQTEDLIGPYVLHDFFLYHFIRWHAEPQKIAYIAEQAFAGQYTRRQIRRWLGVFLQRFIRSQWKRSVATDGPKVGSVSLSPRGDWRMPSDIRSAPWTDALK